MLIACTSCPHGAIEITPAQETVTCPQCQTTYSLLTREILKVKTERTKSGQYLYQLITREPNNSTRLRQFKAQGGLPFQARSWLTLSLQGSTLVGVCEQGHSTWTVIEIKKIDNIEIARFISYLTKAVLLIALLEFARFIELLTERQLQTVILSILAILLMLATPFLARIIQHFKRDPTEHLPTFETLSGEE